MERTRRRFLQTTGASAVAVSGCSGDDSSSATQEPTTAATAPSATPVREQHGPGGQVPETTDQAGIEALDEDGATIRLEPGTTYTIDDPPLRLEGDDLSILGSRSSVIRVPDGTIANNDGPNEMEIAGENLLLEGWTFDGNTQNQGADDTYGIQFQETATNATVANIHNYNSCGDAFGNLRDGAKIVNCYATGFSEDGLDFWGQDGGIVVANSVFEGHQPLKVWTRPQFDFFGGGHITNCAFLGKNSSAINFQGLAEGFDFEYRNFTFSNCLLVGDGDNGNAVEFNTGATVNDVVFRDCRMVSPDSHGLFVHDRATLNDVVFAGGSMRAPSGTGIQLKNGRRCKVLDVAMRAGDPGVRVAGSCQDTVVRGVQGARVADEGTRTVVDGWGANEGDPASTGAWNGNGREGAAVVDATSGDSYVYRGGSWN